MRIVAPRLPKGFVWVLALFAATAAAQQAPTTTDSNAIMGFETLGAWSVKGSSTSPRFSVAITAYRTQGTAALAIANPSNTTKVVSQPIASTATALAGIGDAGARLQIDVLIPVQQGNAVNSGYIQPYVSSKSRGLSKVPLAQIFFNDYRPGIYNTFGFAVPHQVSSALGGAAFNDLVFEFDINSPGQITGSYLLDHLRVHSVPLVQDPTNTPPPPGYGGSVDLVVFGDAPVNQSFVLGPTQIPKAFHLKMGTTGATTVRFQLGLDGQPLFTCTYFPYTGDTSLRSYVLDSCTNGFNAGDLINANWVLLAIDNGGVHSQKIRAQIGLSPLGDMLGAGLLPPMPTFWGDADTCVPAPVAGTVVTLSSSCADQIAEANEIITDYFTQVTNSKPAPNWIVTPVPEFALRHGDGTPFNLLNGPPPTPLDPPFDSGGDLNPGGNFDAYWRLNGNLTPTAVTTSTGGATDENKTHFDATFTAHGVAFGEDVDVVDANVVADTDSGQTTPAYVQATSTGSLALYVFGSQVFSESVNPSVGFSYDPTISEAFNLPPIHIWIFAITIGATADAELKVQGSAAIQGADLSVAPTGTVGFHVQGGIDIGVASGGVDTKISLLTVATPAEAQVKWVLKTSPALCFTELDGTLKGDLTLSSGGGEIDLKATFGLCPFCDTESQTLYKWGPLASTSSNLFSDVIDTQLFALPASLCAFTTTASIVSPTDGVSLQASLPVTLIGSVTPSDPSLALSTSYTWSFTGPSTLASITGTSPVQVTFPQTGQWTISLATTSTETAAAGTKITSSASAGPITVNVANPTSPVNIAELTCPDDNAVFTPDASGFITIGDPACFFVQGQGVTVMGAVFGASGTLNTTFTLAQCTDGTAACTSPGTATTLTATGASTTSPAATAPASLFFSTAYAKITMTTTADGNSLGTSSVVVYDSVIQ